ncbi:MAG: hypothetical protein WCE75_17015 [Terracidiphilus sp.]
MIDAGQLANGLWMGAVLMTLGLNPGTMSGFARAVNRLAEAAPMRLPVPARMPEDLKAPRWFPPAGALVILASLAAYLA